MQKGFAISGILYAFLLLFLVLLLGVLGTLGSRKAILDKIKKEVMDDLNNFTKQEVTMEIPFDDYLG